MTDPKETTNASVLPMPALVDRLAVVARDAFFVDGVDLSELWPTGAPHAVYFQIVRAILAELAKTSTDLPTLDEFMALHGYDNSKSMNAFDSGMRKGIGAAIDRLSPLLAAKDASHATVEKERDRYARTIAYAFDALIACGVTAQLADGIQAMGSRIAALEKQLANAAAPVDANGKTPGQVSMEARYIEHERLFKSRIPTPDELANAWVKMPKWEQTICEAGASAILRAFGNGAEALRQMRIRLALEDDPTGYFRGIIDGEIAKLESQSHGA